VQTLLPAATPTPQNAIDGFSPASSVSWVSRIVIAGATSIVLGILWDISWHRTIGRDTFWTPAHLAIYLGGVLGGLTAGWLILRTTFFGGAEEKAGAVRLWGMRAPFGAWVAVWGCGAMLASAPFDNWWHDAYGLDVKILSPPHTILALGMWAVVFGALFLVLREQNNAPPDRPVPCRWLYIYAAGVLLAMSAVFHIENSFPNDQHAKSFYLGSAAYCPLYLLGLARAAKFRWAATAIALVYMLLVAGMAWLLPLFPGEPKLGPIYHHIDHFVPLPFPMLLVVPAFAIDLIRHWIGHGRSWQRDWLLVLLTTAAFVLLFTATQWQFSKFLLSGAADNWFFAADRHWGYTEAVGDWNRKFWDTTNPKHHPPMTLNAFGPMLLRAFVSARIGLWLGNWMSKVRR